MKKIAFVGTSCVGKTTLVEQSAIEFPQVVVAPELAREYFAKHPELLNRSAKEIQGTLVDVLIANEQKLHELDPEVILCDRAALAAVIYVLASGDEQGAYEILDKIQYWLPTYDLFVLLDPDDVPYKTDSVRTESLAERMHVHDIYLDFLEQSDLPFEMLSGTLEQRIHRVGEIIAQ